MRRIGLLVLLAFLAACGAQSSTPSTPVAMPLPTEQPTAIPIESIELEPLLIQTGDLPAGVEGAQVRDTPPAMFKDMPAATKAIYQQFARGSKQIGGVAVFLYTTPADQDQGYKLLVDGMGEVNVVADIGEQASITKEDPKATSLGISFWDLLFRRCAAIAHIRLTGDGIDDATVIAYAKRLDKRLAAVTCQ